MTWAPSATTTRRGARCASAGRCSSSGPTRPASQGLQRIAGRLLALDGRRRRVRHPMKPFEQQTYYELLEVPRHRAGRGDPRGLRSALMELYSPDSVAVYALVDPEQVDALRERMTEAMEILTDADLRAEYDRIHRRCPRSGSRRRRVRAGGGPWTRRTRRPGSRRPWRPRRPRWRRPRAPWMPKGWRRSRRLKAAASVNDEEAPRASATPGKSEERMRPRGVEAAGGLGDGRVRRGLRAGDGGRHGGGGCLPRLVQPEPVVRLRPHGSAARPGQRGARRGSAPVDEPSRCSRGVPAARPGACLRPEPPPSRRRAAAVARRPGAAEPPSRAWPAAWSRRLRSRRRTEPGAEPATSRGAAPEPGRGRACRARGDAAVHRASPRRRAGASAHAPARPCRHRAVTPSAPRRRRAPPRASRHPTPPRSDARRAPRPPPPPRWPGRPGHRAPAPPCGPSRRAPSTRVPPRTAARAPGREAPRPEARRRPGARPGLGHRDRGGRAGAGGRPGARGPPPRPWTSRRTPSSTASCCAGSARRRGLSLQQLADRTRISARHLENMEADRYDALPAAVYLRGILMNLARELGLDPLRVSKSYLALVAGPARRSR